MTGTIAVKPNHSQRSRLTAGVSPALNDSSIVDSKLFLHYTTI